MLKFIALSLLLLLTVGVFAQYPTEGYNLDNPTFLDSTVADYDVFLTAEMHWRKENSPRKEKMIEYLASRNSVDILVVERSYDFGHWVNYFLETGDSLFLKEYLQLNSFFSTKNGVVYEDEYAFYVWLRQFNLDNKMSIRVVGIDLMTYWFGKSILWSFIKFTEQDPSLKVTLETSIINAKSLLQKSKISTHAMLKWHRELEKSAKGIEFRDVDFSNFMFNLDQSVKYAKGGSYNYRDGQIASNFKRYIQKGQKVYGQYGLTHIALNNGKRIGWNTFGSVLNQDKYYKGKILSVGLICFDCDANTPDNPGEVPGSDIFHHFLTQEDFDRLRPEFKKLPPNTFVDLRGTDEKIKEYCQLLLVQFN